MEIQPVGQQPVLVENGQKTNAPQALSDAPVSKEAVERADSYSISQEAKARVSTAEETVTQAAAALDVRADAQTQAAKAEQAEVEEKAVTFADEQYRAETIGAHQEELSLREANRLGQLQVKAKEVVAHERAHAFSGGGLMIGGPVFQYETGPDGQSYAASAQSLIDMSPMPGNPQGTVFKMQRVRRAALAPLQPSGADRVVANQASQIESQARKLLENKAAKSVEVNVIGVGAEATSVVQETARAELIAQQKSERLTRRKEYDYMGDGVPSEAVRENATKGYARVKPVNRPADLGDEVLKKTEA